MIDFSPELPSGYILLDPSLGLLLGTEAPSMTPNGVDFCFLFFSETTGQCLQDLQSKLWQPELEDPNIITLPVWVQLGV